MGAVYKARHPRLDKIVALKVLPKERTGDANAVARFEREMKAVGRLTHPNIVQAHDAREIDGTTVLVMEYVDGLDLGEVVRRCGPLRGGRRLRDGPAGGPGPAGRPRERPGPSRHQALEPDAHPGRAGEDPRPRPGLAADRRRVGGEMTSSGQVMGTADYMAPEQASDSHKVDIRADIYSLGCTLYKLLTGRAPFAGPEYDNPMKKLLAHMQDPVPPVGQLRQDTPKKLGGVLDRLLAKKPEQRFATPDEVAVALTPFTGGCDLKSLIADSLATDVAADAPRPRSAKRRAPAARRARAAARAQGDDARAAAGVGGGAARRRLRRKPVVLGVALGLLAFGVLAAGVIIVKVRDKQGHVVAEIKVPEGGTAEVVDGGGKKAEGGIHSPGLPSGESRGEGEQPAAAAGTWPLGPAEDALPGIIPRPAKIPGICRWQAAPAGRRRTRESSESRTLRRGARMAS